VPAISIVDLGIVRAVELIDEPEGRVAVVTITPTYSGCPAIDAIEGAIESMLRERGVGHVRLVTRLFPAWTTEWMSPKGREHLRAYGIAPPTAQRVMAFHKSPFARFDDDPVVECPRCDSSNTEMISRFGSTSCKAQYRCAECLEPFDYFKPH